MIELIGPVFLQTLDCGDSCRQIAVGIGQQAYFAGKRFHHPLRHQLGPDVFGDALCLAAWDFIQIQPAALDIWA